jgi:hypothetical protein
MARQPGNATDEVKDLLEPKGIGLRDWDDCEGKVKGVLTEVFLSVHQSNEASPVVHPITSIMIDQ